MTYLTLLPCPFCGKPPKTCADTGYGSAQVYCPDENECGVQPLAEAELNAGETLADAITAWNARTSNHPARPCQADNLGKAHRMGAGGEDQLQDPPVTVTSHSFVPQPWSLGDHLNKWEVSIDGPGWMQLAKVVVRTQGMDGGLVMNRMGWANAHLIAAAPDLYEALDELHLKAVVGTDDERHAALSKAWLALAKARGEA